MTTVNLNELELNEFIGKTNSNQHCKATFPMLGAHGTKKSATVYIELAPGDHLGRHRDNAEELLLILDGNVEVSVGDEISPAGKGTIALVPEMVPHDIKNTGNTPAKIIGFFGGANNIVATFDQAWLPLDSNTVDTARAS
ncbi:MAG: cupin domain-containing protein [Cyclobacteriaceae bacterium]|nr:cupin domain-containing protein [Cyclobacteriaceae bacterium]